MNQRIQKLAEQCWEERKYGPAWFNQEKFAQLIVKECMDQCSQKGAMNNYLDYNQRRWYNECAEKISKHFGVDR